MKKGYLSLLLFSGALVLGACNSNHTHNLVWKYNDETHWRECECGYKEDPVAHKLNAWNSDMGGHWHECECGFKDKSVPHVFDDGEITVGPTETSQGSIKYTCLACGQELIEPISRLLWKQFCEDVSDGNAIVKVEGQEDLIGLDPDTFIIKYYGEYALYYYDSGLAFVDGLGYCSFIINEEDNWQFSAVQMPADYQLDISTSFRTICSFGNADPSKVTVIGDTIQITDLDYAYNIANLCGDWDAYYATKVEITEIEGGYQLEAFIEENEEASWVVAHTVKLTITGFGEQSNKTYTDFVSSYTPTKWNGTFTDDAKAEYEENTFKELRDALDAVSWSDASVILNGRAGFSMVDYSGDKTQEVAEAIKPLGFEFVRSGYDYSYSLHVYYISFKSSAEPYYTSSEYYVNIAYYPSSYYASLGYPEGSYPNGSFEIYLSGTEYLNPSNFESAWNGTTLFDSIKVPQLTGSSAVGLDTYLYYDDGYGELVYNTHMFSAPVSELTVAYDWLAAYSEVVKADTSLEYVDKSEEIPSLDDFDPEFSFYVSYTFEYEDENHYVSVNFSLDYDPFFTGTDIFRVMFWVRAY